MTTFLESQRDINRAIKPLSKFKNLTKVESLEKLS